MTKNKSGAMLRDNAKHCLTGNYYGAVMIQLLTTIIIFFLSQSAVTLSVSAENTLNSLLKIQGANIIASVLSYILLLFASALVGVLNIGLTLYFLGLASGNKSSQWDLFYGYRQQFDKAFSLSFLIAFINTLALLPADILSVVYRKNNGIALPTLAVLLAMQCVFGILLLYFSLGLSQVYFLFLDFPEMTTSKIIKQSFKIMKGHKLSLLFLRISFLPLIFFSLFSLGIGNLWLNPYERTTYSLFYLDLMTPDSK